MHGQIHRFFRAIRFGLQSDLPSSYIRLIPSGSLGSTGITPLHGYYGPIRLLARHTRWLWIPTRRLQSPAGVRGLSVPDLVCRHAPSPSTPGSWTIAYTRCFTVHAGFVHSDGLATPTGVTRLIWVRLTLRLAPSPSGASPMESLPFNARLATWLTGHSKVNSFQFTRQERFH